MKKFLFKAVTLITITLFASCGSDKKEEDPEPEPDMTTLNLNDVKSFYGEWLLVKGQSSDGSFSGNNVYSENRWQITPDGQFIRYSKSSVYDFSAPYTFSNGVFTTDKTEMNIRDIRTYKFEHYDAKYLKVTATHQMNDFNPTTHVYLVLKK